MYRRAVTTRNWKYRTVQPNVLLITVDQFRADCLSAAGHPVVRTPHLDALAEAGVRFARHTSQAAPCGPGRASLYTGMYQMNHRVVGNGSPLDRRFDNIALAARRAGYTPALFGYTDQAIDPRDATGLDDPWLSTYNGVLPGFASPLHVLDDQSPWLAWLDGHGYDTSAGAGRLLATEHTRPEVHSLGAFVTDAVIDWIGEQRDPWFAHVSHLRPHPPFSAAGDWGSAFDPAGVGDPISPADAIPKYHQAVLGLPIATAPTEPAQLAHMRAQYFGMIGHIDHQLGRLFAELRTIGAWDSTLVVVTSDHGEMLGDHGLTGKLGYWEESYAIPCIVREPRYPETHGTVVSEFTENIDVMPTICDAIGVDVPVQVDGYPLTPFLEGRTPERWRDSAHWEFDWRTMMVGTVPHEWPWDRELERQHLAVLRTNDHAYVQFANGDSLCFDLAADPTWRTLVDDAAVVLPLAQRMLTWRSQHADRTLADLVLDVGGPKGRWPPAELKS